MNHLHLVLRCRPESSLLHTLSWFVPCLSAGTTLSSAYLNNYAYECMFPVSKNKGTESALRLWHPVCFLLFTGLAL